MEKPGYKSTEFYLSLVAMLVGAIIASGILDATATPLDNKLVGIIATVLAALGYTASRALVKHAALKTTAALAAANPTKPSPEG